jgi:hypothetical protein
MTAKQVVDVRRELEVGVFYGMENAGSFAQ